MLSWGTGISLARLQSYADLDVSHRTQVGPFLGGYDAHLLPGAVSLFHLFWADIVWIHNFYFLAPQGIGMVST